jgi:hypothetical protein
MICRWTSGRPANHRLNTAAAIADKAPRPNKSPGFWSNSKSDQREPSFVVFAGWGAVGWGTETVLGAGARTVAVTRLVGAATASGATVMLLSYFRYFKPGSLATSAWQQVPSRRRAVFVTRHLWLGVFTASATARLVNWIVAR